MTVSTRQFPVVELLANETAAAVDRAAIEGGIPGIELMENAGRGIVRAVLRRYAPRRCVVLCGPGNNGGDGYVVARRLAAAGVRVMTASTGSRDALVGDAAIASSRWTGRHEPVAGLVPQADDIVIDAVFGSGLTRDFDGDAAAMLRQAQSIGARIIAVDVPSGVNGTTGAVQGWAPTAEMTVTFNRLKLGHVLQPGRSHCGDVLCVDIGIPDGCQPAGPDVPRLNTPGLWLDHVPPADPAHSKYDRGHLAMLGGGALMTGATIMAARSGEATGAGLVTVMCDAVAAPVYASHLVSPMTRLVERADELASFVHDRRVRAIVAGPGMGLGADRSDMLEAALRSQRPCVLDADAITLVAGDTTRFLPLVHGHCVLTPHEGEFGRLHHEPGPKLVRAGQLAVRLGCVVLLKGSDTIVASPCGRAVVNACGPVTLARAGSGDILAGIVGGLLARGMLPYEAALAACWIHAMAALRLGSLSSSEQLADPIAAIMRDLQSFARTEQACSV